MVTSLAKTSLVTPALGVAEPTPSPKPPENVISNHGVREVVEKAAVTAGEYSSSRVIFVSTTPPTGGSLGMLLACQSHSSTSRISHTKANSSSALTASQASFTTRLNLSYE